MKKILKFTLITMIVIGLAGSCFHRTENSDVSANSADSTEIVVDSVVVDSTQVTVK